MSSDFMYLSAPVADSKDRIRRAEERILDAMTRLASSAATINRSTGAHHASRTNLQTLVWDTE